MMLSFTKRQEITFMKCCTTLRSGSISRDVFLLPLLQLIIPILHPPIIASPPVQNLIPVHGIVFKTLIVSFRDRCAISFQCNRIWMLVVQKALSQFISVTILSKKPLYLQRRFTDAMWCQSKKLKADSSISLSSKKILMIPINSPMQVQVSPLFLP